MHLGVSLAALALILAMSSMAAADDVPSSPAGDELEPAPTVSLDQLLKLPDSYEKNTPSDPRAGGDEQQWRQRFAESREQVDAAQTALDAAVSELEEVAGGSGGYSVAPPGATADPTSMPVSFKLRQEIKRQREALDDAQRAHRALEIQADLAGVPPEWRRSQPQDAEAPAGT